jgi:hypothetical protein
VKFLTDFKTAIQCYFGLFSTKSDNDRYIGAVRDSRANQPEFVRSRALIYLSGISLSINYQPNAYTSAGTVNLLSELFNLGRFHTSAFLASPLFKPTCTTP